MNTVSLRNPVVRFLLIIFLLFLAWFVLYELWIHPAGKVDMMIIDFTIAVSKWVLELLGYAVFTGAERVIGVDGTGGLWIGDQCNAIALFALFSAFIIAYKGKAIHKLWYIVFGICTIQLLNILRVIGLAILDTHSREWTEFNHTYTFNIIIYSWIFLLWMHWVNKYSGKPIKQEEA